MATLTIAIPPPTKVGGGMAGILWNKPAEEFPVPAEKGSSSMTGLIVRWFINALAILATAYLVQGIKVEGFTAALVAAFILGIVNAVVRPILILLTLPVNFLTLGLFTFVINGLMLWLVGSVVNGFYVRSLWAGIVGSIVISVISYIMNALVR